MATRKRRYLSIEQKTFDIVGVDQNSIRFFENGKGFRITIFYDERDVEWLLNCFKRFFWVKGEETWARSRWDSRWSLMMMLGQNRRGDFWFSQSIVEEGTDGYSSHMGRRLMVVDAGAGVA